MEEPASPPYITYFRYSTLLAGSKSVMSTHCKIDLSNGFQASHESKNGLASI